MASMFGGTYTCEQLFSTMKFTKSKLRSRISDAYLEDVSPGLSPDVENFRKASSIKCHINAVLLKSECIYFAIFVISMIEIVAM